MPVKTQRACPECGSTMYWSDTREMWGCVACQEHYFDKTIPHADRPRWRLFKCSFLRHTIRLIPLSIAWNCGLLFGTASGPAAQSGALFMLLLTMGLVVALEELSSR